MELLIEKMNKLLATSFAFYLKAHNFHWNIKGQDFHQYHDFFGDLYEEVWGSVDTTAEQIRALGGKAKGSLTEYKESSTVRDQMTDIGIQEMNAMLYRDNDAVISLLNEVHQEAEKQRAFGLLNYIEGRIDTHRKHGWMLSASMDKEVAAPQPVKEEIKEEVAAPVVRTYILNPREL